MTDQEGLEAGRKAIEWMEQGRRNSVLDAFGEYYERMIEELGEEAKIIERRIERESTKAA